MSDELLAVSRSLGQRYRIEREIGRGGMGTVYLARDTRLDRAVALKVLPQEFAQVPELRERFLRETRLAAGYSHPNIVPVFSIEEGDGVLAFAMGFVEGESLDARVTREGPLSQRDAVRLLQDIAYALAYSHGRGVVHRDIKPDNIMIERATGRALVMDFGIARAITPVDAATPAAGNGLTRVGEVVGTPEYMSPEQAVGDAVDGRSDLYALGLVAWFALTAQTAFTGESTQRILVRQLTEAVPPLESMRPDLPDSLCAVVNRCCEKNAADRYPTAEALIEALDATQLATPDIPVAIRLLVPDLTAIIGRVSVAFVLLGYGNYRLVSFGNASIFSFGLMAGALAWVRTLTTARDIRELARGGFTVEALQQQLARIQAERDAVRAQRRLDVPLVQRRKRRVWIAAGILAWQAFTLVQMLQGKISDGDANLQGRRSILLFFAALTACALCVGVLATSPFRRPVMERLFVWTWLGGFGRRFFGLAMGRQQRATATAVVRAPTAAVGAMVTVQAPPSPAPASLERLAGDVRALQQRVERLERR
jgi:eukaryotic-like serine/threonine-protein kinase